MNKNTIIAYLFLVGAVVLGASGCASRQGAFAEADGARDRMTPGERFTYDYQSAALARMKDDARLFEESSLIGAAKEALGTPYVRGGTTQSGFDCSGFVQWAYRHAGVTLPRTAREQATVGKLITNKSEMIAGDIVAFRHPRRGYHTGIYVGEGKFVHSPRKRKTVRINSLSDPYFRSTFLGARRVTLSSSEDIEAARRLLALYESGSFDLRIRAQEKAAPVVSKKSGKSSKKNSKVTVRSNKKSVKIKSKAVTSKKATKKVTQKATKPAVKKTANKGTVAKKTQVAKAK